MNSAHRKILDAVFSHPVPKALKWADIEGLFQACGCRVSEGAGSRVRVSLGDAVLNAHRPHPGKEAKPYQVRDARAFLERIGVTPGKEDK